MSLPASSNCWNQTGVQGDRSCPELTQHLHCRNCPIFAKGAETLLQREPPAGYTEEWTRLLAQAKTEEVRHTEVALVFRIGLEWLALPARCCLEVVAPRPIRRVPHFTKRALQGLASVRGEILLCFSLADLLGLAVDAPAAPAGGARAIPRMIVACRDRFTGIFPADEVTGLHRFSMGGLQPIPATHAHATPQFSCGVLTVDGRKAGLLDDELVFLALAKDIA